MTTRSFSSRTIRLGSRLLAASTLVTGALVLQGCDDQKTESGVYPNAQACTARGIFTQGYCEENFKKAQAEHLRSAPHYATKEDCERDWDKDQCEDVPTDTSNQNSSNTHHGGSTVVIVNSGNRSGGYEPRMSGYWVGTTTQTSSSSAPTEKTFAYPVYKAKDGSFRSLATGQSFESFGRTGTSPDFEAARTAGVAERPVFGAGKSYSASGEAMSIVRGGFGETAHAAPHISFGE